MIYLFIGIFAMSAIMLALKFFSVKGINTPQAITVNYLMASLIGLLSHPGKFSADSMFNNDWWYIAMISGALFFSSMDLMAVSTRKAGVAITTIASRVALIIPVLFAHLFLGEDITSRQLSGIALVVAALLMIFWQKGKNGNSELGNRWSRILLPLGVFLIMGVIAITMKFGQHTIKATGNYSADYPIFEAMIFFSALVCAVITYLASKGAKIYKPDWKSILGGVCLGASNFITTYCILHGLRSLPTSVFYPSYYVGVVIVTSLVGMFVFKEKLSTRKLAGIGIAIVAIVILSSAS